MKKLEKTIWLAAAALLGGSAARAQQAAPSGACADRERFGALYDETVREATAGNARPDAVAISDALARVRGVMQAACPSLPWSVIAHVADVVASDDLAVRLGTTPLYEFEQLMRQTKSAGQNAIASCTGGSAIDLTRCLTEHVCRETGANSCLCMPAEQRARRPVCE
jgi:hypothetical protein